MKSPEPFWMPHETTLLSAFSAAKHDGWSRWTGSGSAKLVLGTWPWERVLHRAARAARSWRLLWLVVPHWIRNVHRNAICFNPISICSVEVSIAPLVCRQDQWNFPQEHLVRKQLCCRLPQLRPIHVRLKQLLVVHNEIWPADLVQYDGQILAPAEIFEVWMLCVLHIHHQSVLIAIKLGNACLTMPT